MSVQEAVSVHETLQLQAAAESIVFHSRALLDQIARLKLQIILTVTENTSDNRTAEGGGKEETPSKVKVIDLSINATPTFVCLPVCLSVTQNFNFNAGSTIIVCAV